MKKYKVEYWRGSVDYLSEFLNSKRWNGTIVSFFHDGRKCWQYKFKNDLKNGLEKNWMADFSKNIVLQNYKKGDEQGIKIGFSWK